MIGPLRDWYDVAYALMALTGAAFWGYLIFQFFLGGFYAVRRAWWAKRCAEGKHAKKWVPDSVRVAAPTGKPGYRLMQFYRCPRCKERVTDMWDAGRIS